MTCATHIPTVLNIRYATQFDLIPPDNWFCKFTLKVPIVLSQPLLNFPMIHRLSWDGREVSGEREGHNTYGQTYFAFLWGRQSCSTHTKKQGRHVDRWKTNELSNEELSNLWGLSRKRTIHCFDHNNQHSQWMQFWFTRQTFKQGIYPWRSTDVSKQL